MPTNRIEWYLPPRQIRQWGEPEPHKSVDHFGSFYDLTFVAGAFVAGQALKANLTAPGVLTFAGFVFLMRDVWMGNLLRVARFQFTSFFHSALDVINLALTMLLVLGFEDTERLFNPSSGTALALVLTFLSIKLLDLARNWDVSRWSPSDHGASHLRNSLWSIATSAAAAVGAVVYCVTATKLEYLWVFLYLATLPQPIVSHIRVKRSKRRGTSHKSYVPLSVRYVIERNVEWAMLMLGESVLSLLIVPVERTVNFYVVFLACSLTVSMVYLHHFENYELDPDKHALRLRTEAPTRGLAFEYSRMAVSVTLIAVGVSFKVLLERSSESDLPAKYSTLFGLSLGLSLLLADLSAVLHDTGVNPSWGFFAYWRVILANQHRLAGRNLLRVWVAKVALVLLCFTFPAMGLSALGLALLGFAVAFCATALVVLESHRSEDIEELCMSGHLDSPRPIRRGRSWEDIEFKNGGSVKDAVGIGGAAAPQVAGGSDGGSDSGESGMATQQESELRKISSV